MPGKAVRFPQEILDWFEAAAASENELRRHAGLLPIADTDLLRLVAGKFAGLPVSLQIDLEALQARMFSTPPNPPIGKARAKKGSADMVNPPHGGARATTDSSSFITTPPTGGKTKARASKDSSFMTKPPNGGKTKARTNKGSSSFITTPPHPPTGKARA
jgi:hypothetical protein